MNRAWSAPVLDCLDIAATAGGQIQTHEADQVWNDEETCYYWTNYTFPPDDSSD